MPCSMRTMPEERTVMCRPSLPRPSAVLRVARRLPRPRAGVAAMLVGERDEHMTKAIKAVLVVVDVDCLLAFC